MFLHLLLAFACAKIKGYKIMPIFKAYALYPYFIMELLYLVLQINILFDNYGAIKYSAIIKSVYLYTLIIPILVYKLYKQGILGSVLIIIGTLLNRFVMEQNGGKMPVYASLSKLTGYYDEEVIQSVDNIHIVGTESSKFKYLADFIDTGFSILSVGDLLIHSFIFIVIYYVIKEINISTSVH